MNSLLDAGTVPRNRNQVKELDVAFAGTNRGEEGASDELTQDVRKAGQSGQTAARR
jgi:hypothetical protein